MALTGKAVEARVGTRVIGFETGVSGHHDASVVVRCGDSEVRVTPAQPAGLIVTAQETIDVSAVTRRLEALHERRRQQGRALTQIRAISIDFGTVSTAQGSAVFTRGEAETLVAATLGSCRERQRPERENGPTSKRLPLHDNSGHEMGRDALAERALLPVVPSRETFPYTMQVVSSTRASNGASFSDALPQARIARMQILDAMSDALRTSAP